MMLHLLTLCTLHYKVNKQKKIKNHKHIPPEVMTTYSSEKKTYKKHLAAAYEKTTDVIPDALA